MSKTLNELCDLAVNNAKAKGFNDVNVPTQLCLIHSEVSEALEDFREGRKPDEFLYESNDTGDIFTENQVPVGDKYVGYLKPVGIPSEIADVLIRCFDFAGRFGIDLDRAVTEKMIYNSNRKYKHGKQV